MEIRFVRDGDRAVIRLSGHFNYDDAFPFFAVAEKAVRNNAPGGIWVDLAGVSYIDSSGIGKLIHLNKQAQALGQKVTFINLQLGVQAIFKTMRLDKLLTLD